MKQQIIESTVELGMLTNINSKAPKWVTNRLKEISEKKGVSIGVMVNEIIIELIEKNGGINDLLQEDFNLEFAKSFRIGLKEMYNSTELMASASMLLQFMNVECENAKADNCIMNAIVIAIGGESSLLQRKALERVILSSDQSTKVFLNIIKTIVKEKEFVDVIKAANESLMRSIR